MKLLLLALAALLMPAARTATAATPPTAKTAPRPVTPLKSDAEIERTFRERLSRSKIGRNGFQIRVQGGVATLTGRTDVIQHKGAATRMAKTSGARSVRNQIEITEAARQRAAANLEKGRQARVKAKVRSEPRSEPR